MFLSPSRSGGKSMLVGLCLAVSASFTTPQLAFAQQTITWGKPSEVLSTDPHRSGSATSWTVYFMVYEQLVNTDDNMKAIPGVAESWEQTSPTSYTFHLRPSFFSNGRPLTSADVVGSIKRVVDPKFGASSGKLLSVVKDVTAVDDHTVAIELNSPLTPLIQLLSASTLSIMPIKEMEDGTFDPSKEMLGSGPFMVKEHLQDESWTLQRNPHYWRAGYPKADEIVVRIMPDDATRIAALKEGRVDIATFENPDTPRLLDSIPNVNLFIQKTPNYFRLDVNGRQPTSIFSDDRLRTALSYATDRQRIVDVVFGGDSSIEYPVPAAFNPPAGCTDHPSYTLSREERMAKAKALVEEADAVGKKVSIIASPVLSTYPLIAQVLEQDLKEIGFDVQIEQLPVAEWYKRVFVEKPEFDIAIAWFAGFTEPSIILSDWEPGLFPYFEGYVKPVDEYKVLAQEVRALPAGQDRDAKLSRACEIISDAANMYPLVNKPDYIGYRADQIDARFSETEGNFDTLKYIEEFVRK